MKLLVVASTIDLKYRLGCTPAWWQLLKALHETGNEVILTPYLGDPIESLWWRTYKNPCSWESKLFNSYLERKKTSGVLPAKRNLLSPAFEFIITRYIRPRWKKHVLDIVKSEEGIDAVIFMSVPLNHLCGIPSAVKNDTGIPLLYYDGDMPIILPKYAADSAYKFNYYENADLAEYDAFLSNSNGVTTDLVAMGARNVQTLHYAIDPELCSPLEIEKDIDISFFGYGSEFREEWMKKLIADPSREMTDARFVVAGAGFRIDLGKAEMIGDLSYSEWRQFCSRSKINLNITRWSHASIHESSTMRPFELAAFRSCIVSQPYDGIEAWFDVGKEIYVVHSGDEAIDTYTRLLNNKAERENTARLARDRVLKNHTYRHRAAQLLEIIAGLR